MEIFKNLYTQWCKIDDKIRFLLIGGVNAVFSYILFILFIFILGTELRQVCVALQWTFSSVFSYFNQKIFVFQTKGNYLKEYLKCCSTWIVGCTLNLILLDVVLRLFHNVLLSQLISLALVSVVTYILFKFFAFKKEAS